VVDYSARESALLAAGFVDTVALALMLELDSARVAFGAVVLAVAFT